MKVQSHLFIINCLEKLNKSMDTSLGMALALKKRGLRVFAAESKDLFLSSDSLVPQTRSAYELLFERQQVETARRGNVEQTHSLEVYQVIYLRTDPPVDLSYFWATWVLDHAKKLGVLVLNQPDLLRDFNEKVGILEFRDYIPPTLVSQNVAHLLEYIAGPCGGEAVIKPLDQFGGVGVEKLCADDPDLSERLQAATASQKTPVMVQRYRKEVLTGEVRVFCVHGQPLAWCLKIPKPGEFRANTGQGSKVVDYKPSADEIALTHFVAKKLLPRGATFLGLDLIGGQITEINVTSPRLLYPGDKGAHYDQCAAILLRGLG